MPDDLLSSSLEARIASPIPGTYALVLRSRADTSVQIGRCGTLLIQPGFYVYVGSALGPGGLRARLTHHLRQPARLHWHIDHLRRRATVVAAWYRFGRARREHTWAKLLRDTTGSSIPLPGFGSSDCKCPSHLFYFSTLPILHLRGAELLDTADLIGSGTS